MEAKEQRANVKNPRAGANFFKVLTFSWIVPTFRLGYQRDLEEDDLYSPLKEHTSSILGDKISKAWEEELERVQSAGGGHQKKYGAEGFSQKKKQPSLFRVIFKCFGARMIMYGIMAGVGTIAVGVIQPLLLGRLLRYYSSSDDVGLSETQAYLYASGIILSALARSFILNPYAMAIMHIGMKIRVSCCTLIYRKALKLSKTALGETATGQAVNLLSNDVNRFDQTMLFLNFLWIGPVQIIISAYFIYTEVGVSGLVGIAAILMFIPLQGYLGRRSSHYRLRIARRTDERVRLTNEIINGIQAIKMYTWEKPFADLVQRARNKEVSVIKATSYLRGIVVSFPPFVTRFCLFVSVLAYVLLGNDVTAEKVFMLTAYFNILREAMTIFFPQGLTQGGEMLVSIRRLQNFLMYDEALTTRSPGSGEKPGDGSVKMENGSAKWLDDATENTLHDINVEVKPGQLIAIVGRVGSGKSSLLHAILRELPLCAGTIKVDGKTAYASQDPWLFAGSVRQNILFGSEMDPRKYERVVKVCQLKRDFTLFPYGDKTIVGDRGVSLSGGQRARINLARAVYANADIYLMDDPLSAVDTHVGKAMFEECIAGYLDGKTRILVTHQIQFLKNVDRIIVLKDGAVRIQGTWDELQSSGLNLDRFLQTQEEDKSGLQRSMNQSLSRLSSVRSGNSVEFGDSSQELDITAPKEVAEERSVGSIGGKVYTEYIRSAGNWYNVTLVLTLVALTQVIISGSDYFISLWVDLEEKNASTQPGETEAVWDSPLSRDICIYIYSSLVLATIVSALTRSISFYTLCMRASRRLHDRMFRGISRASMRFFNTNSSGRILNRFSKDMGTVDETLPTVLIDCLQMGLTLFGIVVNIGIANFWLIIPTAVLAGLFYFLRGIYLRTSRSVKRLEGITRSPVFAHLNATLQGLTTIRAFEAGEVLTREFDRHQDLHSSAWFIFLGSTRGFTFWLDVICVFYLAAVTYSFLVIPDLQASGGNVGLAITQSIGLAGLFQYAMRQSAELENQMTSVERVLEYSVVDCEPPLESSPENKPDPIWPSEGWIEFKKFSMGYGPDDPPVLKNLNFVIKPREKVGIVGRTGAGKSSLVSALFRLAYPSGEIIIDGVESGKLGLHDLRSKISIIPQEPFLFSGTLRRNLDPFDEYPDSALWQALEEVELKEMGLESHVAEGGTNLSVGQRQLVCLARAIARKNRILILDEATANVDLMTDRLIQKTIRGKFANCTVLTIAHRLNTVMDSDKVLVMDAGMAVEYDHPHVLLQIENGYLRGMVDQTGKSMAEALSSVAKNNYLTQSSTSPIVEEK